MNRLLYYELKKLVLRKEMLIVLVFLLIYFTLSTGVRLSQFEYATVEGELKGVEAVKAFRGAQANLEGPLTAERISSVIETYIKIHSKASNLDSNGEVLDAVFVEKLLPYESIRNTICLVFSPVGKYDYYKIEQLEVKDGTRFYEQYSKIIKEKGMVMGNLVQKPFYYGYHLGWLTIIQNLWIHSIVLTLCMCISLASVFAGERECGMEPILRCAKNGRKPLSRAKVQSAFYFATAIFVIVMGLYLFGVLYLYGIDGGRVSLQIVSTFSPIQVNLAQTVGLCLLISFSGYLALVTVTLFLSKKLKKTLAASVGVVAVLIVPMFIPMQDQSGLSKQLLYLLPSNLMNASELVKYSLTSIWLGLMLSILWISFMIRDVVKQ